MKEILHSAITTLIILISDIVSQKKRESYHYAIIFFLIAGLGFTCSSLFSFE